MGESIFPMEPNTPEPDQEPRFVPLEDAGAMLDALASGTARTIVASLRDEPKTPSNLAERADMSLQNTLYHLNQLRNAELVEPVDTQYSTRRREMSVYALQSEPVLICAGDESADAEVARLSESQPWTTPELAESD